VALVVAIEGRAGNEKQFVRAADIMRLKLVHR